VTRPATPSYNGLKPDFAFRRPETDFHLTPLAENSMFPLFSKKGPMSRVCSITGAKPTKGHVIHRRGMAKKKGGVGQHVTANTPRLFVPNLKTRRIWVPELERFVTVKLSTRALKTIAKNGAYQTLKAAGLV
jgi:large subunit ribosomal protein L28